jgi:hypothetical protein
MPQRAQFPIALLKCVTNNREITILDRTMKQPEDLSTIELPLDAALAKKRGRPPKEDKLSDAERARRYRARQKMRPKGAWNYDQVTTQTRTEIERLLGSASSRPAGEAELVAQWAYGMFLLWDRVTAQRQQAADRDALLALVSG